MKKMKNKIKNVLLIIGTIFTLALVLSSCKKNTPEPQTVERVVNTNTTNTVYDTVYVFQSDSVIKTGLASFPNSTGLDASGWPSITYTVTAGMRIDSVQCKFLRPGSPQYCDLNISVNGVDVTNYTTDNNSMYYKWYNLLSYNVTVGSKIIISCPPSSVGGNWNEGVLMHFTKL